MTKENIISVEELKHDDLAGYKNLVDECFGGSNDISVYRDNYHENDKQYEILVAKIDGKIVGSITFIKLNLFTFSFQPMLEIFNVATLPAYRGRGVAKKIFEHVLKFAKENNYKTITLTCLETADDAHKLYESLGFNRASSRKYTLDV